LSGKERNTQNTLTALGGSWAKRCAFLLAATAIGNPILGLVSIYVSCKHKCKFYKVHILQSAVRKTRFAAILPPRHSVDIDPRSPHIRVVKVQ